MDFQKNVTYNEEPINFNQAQFHNDCKKIIEDIKERFIDLAPEMMDNEGSNYAG